MKKLEITPFDLTQRFIGISEVSGLTSVGGVPMRFSVYAPRERPYLCNHPLFFETFVKGDW